MLLSQCKVWTLSLNAPIFPIFFLFNHFRKKNIWITIQVHIPVLPSEPLQLHQNSAWMIMRLCIKTLDLSKHSNDQFELQPRHTFSDNMCPRRHFQGDLIYLKSEIFSKRKWWILHFCFKIKPSIFHNHNIKSTLN